MLRNYLTNIPFTKFVLIEDTLQEKGDPFFDFLFKLHLEQPNNKIHYFVFQEPFVRTKSRLGGSKNVVLHDFVSNTLGWNKVPEMCVLDDMVKHVGVNDFIFIDSLAHIIYEYGLAEAYRILHLLKNNVGVQQIIALIHQDLFEDKWRIQLIEHLSTLTIIMQPKNGASIERIEYIYKKVGGLVSREFEDFWFEGEKLITQKIEKLDSKQLVEKSISTEVNPETLSTFKIGLSDADKKLREDLVLPYLPKQESQNEQQSGNIFYQFDEADDWDEEDPDDDLDI